MWRALSQALLRTTGWLAGRASERGLLSRSRYLGAPFRLAARAGLRRVHVIACVLGGLRAARAAQVTLSDAFGGVRAARRALEARRSAARDYPAWASATLALETLRGPRELEQAALSGARLYDERLVKARTGSLRLAREDAERGAPGGGRRLAFELRGDLIRDLGNLACRELHDGPRWRPVPPAIRAYVREAKAGLRSLTACEEVPLAERAAFLREVRHAYGRTALVLSGGGSFGAFHLGVVRALLQAGLLPRILAGSSAGAICAAMIATRTEPELAEMLAGVEDVEPEPIYNSDTFRALLAHLFRKGTLQDSAELRRRLRRLFGDLTFADAYARTGRVLCVAVTAADTREPPRLLNHLTSPNVLIWAAVACSSAFPLLYAPQALLARDPDGNVVEWGAPGSSAHALLGDELFIGAAHPRRPAKAPDTRGPDPSSPILQGAGPLGLTGAAAWAAAIPASTPAPGATNRPGPAPGAADEPDSAPGATDGPGPAPDSPNGSDPKDADASRARSAPSDPAKGEGGREDGGDAPRGAPPDDRAATGGASAPHPHRPQRRWRDGSLELDLPMNGLSELFNVNYFVVSQCNPYLLPVIALKRAIHPTLATLLESEFKHRCSQLAELLPDNMARGIAGRALKLVNQPWEGDCTVVLPAGTFHAGKAVVNFDREDVRRALKAGTHAMFAKLDAIEANCSIEVELDECVHQVRAATRERAAGTARRHHAAALAAAAAALDHPAALAHHLALAHPAAHPHALAGPSHLDRRRGAAVAPHPQLEGFIHRDTAPVAAVLGSAPATPSQLAGAPGPSPTPPAVEGESSPDASRRQADQADGTRPAAAAAERARGEAAVASESARGEAVAARRGPRSDPRAVSWDDRASGAGSHAIGRAASMARPAIRALPSWISPDSEPHLSDSWAGAQGALAARLQAEADAADDRAAARERGARVGAASPAALAPPNSEASSGGTAAGKGHAAPSWLAHGGEPSGGDDAGAATAAAAAEGEAERGGTDTPRARAGHLGSLPRVAPRSGLPRAFSSTSHVASEAASPTAALLANARSGSAPPPGLWPLPSLPSRSHSLLEPDATLEECAALDEDAAGWAASESEEDERALREVSFLSNPSSSHRNEISFSLGGAFNQGCAYDPVPAPGSRGPPLDRPSLPGRPVSIDHLGRSRAVSSYEHLGRSGSYERRDSSGSLAAPTLGPYLHRRSSNLYLHPPHVSLSRRPSQRADGGWDEDDAGARVSSPAAARPGAAADGEQGGSTVPGPTGILPERSERSFGSGEYGNGFYYAGAGRGSGHSGWLVPTSEAYFDGVGGGSYGHQTDLDRDAGFGRGAAAWSDFFGATRQAPGPPAPPVDAAADAADADLGAPPDATPNPRASSPPSSFPRLLSLRSKSLRSLLPDRRGPGDRR